MNRSYAPETPTVLMSKRTSVTILVSLAVIFVLARFLLAVVPTQLALELQQGYLAWPLLVIIPALLGLTVGSGWVLLDMLRPVSAAPHATFPGIVFLYTYAAILAEVVNRLFFATFVVWVVAIIILRCRVCAGGRRMMSSLLNPGTSVGSQLCTRDDSGEL